MLAPAQADFYRENGYLAGLRVADESQAAEYRRQFDALEAAEGRDKTRIGHRDEPGRHRAPVALKDIITRALPPLCGIILGCRAATRGHPSACLEKRARHSFRVCQPLGAILHAEVRVVDNVVSAQPLPQTAADYEAAVEQLLAEVKRLNQHMQSDRTDIERLKTETRTLKAETRALLLSMGAKF
jgi:hypothetical protein